MPRYYESLKQAWIKLLQDYGECKFNPQHEADIQGYLYHCCWAILENQIKRPDIFMEYRKKERARHDLRLGRKPLVVEVKWSSPRARQALPKSWRHDVDRLHKARRQNPARQPAFVLFVAPKPLKLVVPHAQNVLQDVARLQEYARSKGVKVISIDEFPWHTISRRRSKPPEKRQWIEQLARAQTSLQMLGVE